MSNSIKRAEIFATGLWPSSPPINLGESDLDSIVASFEALSLSGRVPLKLGHKGKDTRYDDGAPALGWIDRIWREGDRLLADIKDIPKVVYDGIKNGLYKFVSVELLKDVKADTRRIPWVLDAVALLGATQPAVGILKDLQSLTMARRPQLQFAERLTFSRAADDEPAQLRERVAKLNAQLVTQTFNAAIQAGRILPAERERFERRYGKDASIEDAQAWIADCPRPPASLNRPTGRESSDNDAVHVGGRADEQLVAAAIQLQEKAAERGQTLSYEAASKIVMQRDPDLARRWVTFPDEHYV